MTTKKTKKTKRDPNLGSTLYHACKTNEGPLVLAWHVEAWVEPGGYRLVRGEGADRSTQYVTSFDGWGATRAEALEALGGRLYAEADAHEEACRKTRENARFCCALADDELGKTP